MTETKGHNKFHDKKLKVVSFHWIMTFIVVLRKSYLLYSFSRGF